MQQAEDFRRETDALANILANLSEDAFELETQFKAWMIGDVIGHLHMFNVAAEVTLKGPKTFNTFFTPFQQALERGSTFVEAQRPWLGALKGTELFETWLSTAHRVADLYAKADPKQRVAWAGPDMSALSSISARQMETWAHGQEVFDVLGRERYETDRIRNIVHLGAATFGWSFINRDLVVPQNVPHLRLSAPSGAIWTWNKPSRHNVIEGPAVAFAQVVTQVRNIADVDLDVTGETAHRWMEIAQCFAGAPSDPPVPGSRRKAGRVFQVSANN
ncbi:TIGR03084 family metal-binding protein [Thalassococcus sp. S3]|uniref:TIGR03084 family metal-binding protein n=1 Tax=Thalassococcus sp. S3 TaxID=2017482 RepID=UPI00102406E8|nr:TIGR03084 family metal-binding protein [Thalassococcus sp. S3]QBF30554.1 TIGR03084 family protein [Thalassococcus sp. S3]